MAVDDKMVAIVCRRKGMASSAAWGGQHPRLELGFAHQGGSHLFDIGVFVQSQRLELILKLRGKPRNEYDMTHALRLRGS